MARPVYSADETENLRQTLVRGALELYLEEGMDNVTLRRIAKRVGLSHTVGYRYFANKEALVAEMRRACLLELKAAAMPASDDERDPIERIRSTLRELLAFGSSQPAKYRLIFSDTQPDLTEYPPLLTERWEFFASCVDLVQTAIDQKRLHGNALLLTHGLWSLLHGMLSLHTANQLVHGLSLREMAWPLIDSFLHAGDIAPPTKNPQPPTSQSSHS
ncbi:MULTISPECIES: TetR/AcrR family transcriptional regulator [unclassified Pseudomonas]|uniref:TetR/AcrR family transcriptional regulator n=1 Tax=unclassified Pseudomonas TaxID=196821 RepID=UPI000871299A|nr:MULTISPECIES: TetR/AcrR family transcriptional regulator [unclassified Pseudomonas]SCW31372.1 transcriptional regulator, TetR family [Pseudomonas sp. NFACC05-1]SDY54506.1 transcriptional regulator, TetR family [Pseudomonas sp. NFACC08-1]SEI49594.1 transcriptional regulator, TetR family [Pseudomonas sp. NFACC07-1]SFL07050.1 transcriptional regulator, TetR family [Pseudomonas sp. NFACC46-3]